MFSDTKARKTECVMLWLVEMVATSVCNFGATLRQPDPLKFLSQPTHLHSPPC